jgi:hypothetical protein
MDEPLKVDPDGERVCRCVKTHNPAPRELHRHHIWPTSEGGPNTKINLRWLCPSSHANAHRLWREYEKVGGEPLWEIRRMYGPYVRQLVSAGWAQAHPLPEKE